MSPARLQVSRDDLAARGLLRHLVVLMLASEIVHL
jgi:hypothetical protein